MILERDKDISQWRYSSLFLFGKNLLILLAYYFIKG